MHVANHGPLAAALILAGVSLAGEFNLDDGSLSRHDERLRGENPTLDKEAINTLAICAAAKDLVAEMALKQKEAEIANANAGGKPSDAKVYIDTAKDHAAKLESEIEATRLDGIRQKAVADAEAETLKKHGLKRAEDGSLVPADPDPEAEFKAKVERDIAAGSGTERWGKSRPDTADGPDKPNEPEKPKDTEPGTGSGTVN